MSESETIKELRQINDKLGGINEKLNRANKYLHLIIVFLSGGLIGCIVAFALTR